MMQEYYLLVPRAERESFQARTDAVKGPSQLTTNYSEPIEPNEENKDYPFDLWAIDDRAESVLTPEERASRLATMPAEFVRPLPQP